MPLAISKEFAMDLIKLNYVLISLLENGDVVLVAHYLLYYTVVSLNYGAFGHIIFSFIVGNLFPHLDKLGKLVCTH